MTDLEIKQYLEENNYKIKASDGIGCIFNTSPQIVEKRYDFENHLMNIITPNNSFVFEWILEKL